jgi:hypothetical protein
MGGKNVRLSRNYLLLLTIQTISSTQSLSIFRPNIRRLLHLDMFLGDLHQYNFANMLNSFRFLDEERMEWKILMYATWNAAD